MQVLPDRAHLIAMVSPSQVEFVQLVRELTRFQRRDVTHGIKLAKYKKGANGMLKKDPVAANTLLGVVACLEHDLASMHAFHKKAIESGESTFSLMYYSASLEKSCLWSEAARYALLALDLEPDNAEVLETVIRLAPLTGRFSLLKRLLQQWQQRNDGLPHPRQADCETVAGILSANNLLEKDLKDVLGHVGEGLTETDVILQGFSYDLVAEPDSSFLHYRFVVPDHFVASYYEDLIAARLHAAPCHPRIFDAFSFTVENAAVYELYDYMEKEMANSAETIRVPAQEKIKQIEELIEGVEI